jgi:hypothetical protein
MASLVDAPLKGGFNQSGGGYYMIFTALTGAQILNYNGGSGSGGSYNVGLVSTYVGVSQNGGPAVPNVGLTDTDWSTAYFRAGRLLKDMGKTVVSSGRTFRKFQAVYNGLASNSSPTFGVGGPAGTTTAPGYLSVYLEVGREGAGVANGANPLPLIARYA